MTEPTEDQIQASFFEWLALHEKKHPELALFYAIPNGSYKSVSARMKFKRTGLKSGVPDVHLPLCNKQVDFEGDWDMSEYNGLWIEFKSKKGIISEQQKEWMARLKHQCHRVEVCRSWTEAANATIEYLGLPIEKL